MKKQKKNDELPPMLPKEFVMKKFVKKVKPQGTSGYVQIPREFVGDTAEITIKRKWRICGQCDELHIGFEHFPEGNEYCTRCTEGIKRFEILKEHGSLKCQECGKPVSEQDFRKAKNNLICGKCTFDSANRYLDSVILKLDKKGDKKKI